MMPIQLADVYTLLLIVVTAMNVVNIFIAWWQKRFQSTGQSVSRRLDQLEQTVKNLNLSILRQEIQQEPQSRFMHQELLRKGEEYINKGGNSYGHVRVEQLKKEYLQRALLDDWDYSHNIYKKTNRKD
jgi:hypothetical protein